MEDSKGYLIESADLLKGRASRALLFKRYKQRSKLQAKVEEEKRKRDLRLKELEENIEK